MLIDSARLMVCPDCASLGSGVKIKTQQAEFGPTEPGSMERKSTFFHEHSHKLEEATAVVEDLGILVRKARERKDLTREELAKKIFEKASVVHRIESGAYVPDDRIRKKLEKELGVRLEANE